ncbi:MAG: acyltransferase [Chitinophagaceae bacterium]|nr:acyltransferase [Chitinophagaceae bacterium]
MQQTGRISNLDGLRFLAAAVVAICHFDIIKAYYGLERTGWRFFSNAAQMAVSFFFVLSGFLISYLLLKEKYASPDNRFRLFQFYGKRIRRIWPLYYLLLLLSFFVFPKIEGLHSAEVLTNDLHLNRLTGYLVWLPNYTEYQYGPQPFLGQTWSLAVEEFFYLFFPIGLYFVKKKNVLRYFFLLIFLSLLLTVLVYLLNNYSRLSADVKSVLYVIADKYRIYAFGAGALVAWVLLNKDHIRGRWLLFIRQKGMAFGLSILLTFLVLGGITFSWITQQVYAFLFSLLILSLVSSGIRFALLNHRVMLYLGKISYGIYMLHPIAIVICLQLSNHFLPFGMMSEILLVIASMLVTVLLSALSYEMMEKHFLKGRKRERIIE